MTKKEIAFIRSLHQKKSRQMYGKFLVEGDKLVNELLASDYKVDAIYHLENWKPSVSRTNFSTFIVSKEELNKISTHENPDQVLAVAPIKINTVENTRPMTGGLYLACDGLNDPGNAGTIIRIADWFGIKKVFFAHSSVDVYNPKVVSAAKGSLFRTECIYTDLAQLFTENTELKVYGAVMAGENIYQAALNQNAFIVIGNEANGISRELLPFIQQNISIPSFGKAESLNAGVAAGIIVSEFKRRTDLK
ncbi:MAG: RNA methyltransferase [Bacteroidetes bacterium]|nr:RNA methyltransferase [Bacteroidota bacterium]